MKQRGCLGIYSERGLCLVAYSARGLKSILCCLPATFLKKLDQKTSANGLDYAEADNPAIPSPNCLRQHFLSTEALRS